MTEKLLTYALGRGVDYDDAPTVRQLVRDWRETTIAGRRWSLGIVQSMPFQMRRVGDPDRPDTAPSRRSNGRRVS